MITLTGAFGGLAIAIFLILKKVHPVYALLAGSVLGGVLGGAGMHQTIEFMFAGSREMLPAVLRVLAAGVLAGVLMETGASVTIAQTIIHALGEKRILWALALSTYVLTASGVFIYVAVITVAPIALSLGARTGISRQALLLAMIGGGKSGNIISPNPNTLAVAGFFKVELTTVMLAGVLPSLLGMVLTGILAGLIVNKGNKVSSDQIGPEPASLPSFLASLSGPLTAIVLLALKPLAGIPVDPLLALPAGGLVAVVSMGKAAHFNACINTGLKQTLNVAVILLCTGCIAGIISNSTLRELIISGLHASGLSKFLLPPLAGIFMGAATASTTSGAAVASSVFGPIILTMGIAPLAAAAMINAGATVLDHLPHGSFFHASGGSVSMTIKERLRLIPFETCIGLGLTLGSTLLMYFFST